MPFLDYYYMYVFFVFLSAALYVSVFVCVSVSVSVCSLCIIYDRYSLRRIEVLFLVKSNAREHFHQRRHSAAQRNFFLLLLLVLLALCCVKLRFRPTVRAFSSAAGSVVSALRAAPCLSVINHLDFIYNNYARLKKLLEWSVVSWPSATDNKVVFGLSVS